MIGDFWTFDRGGMGGRGGGGEGDDSGRCYNSGPGSRLLQRKYVKMWKCVSLTYNLIRVEGKVGKLMHISAIFKLISFNFDKYARGQC